MFLFSTGTSSESGYGGSWTSMSPSVVLASFYGPNDKPHHHHNEATTEKGRDRSVRTRYCVPVRAGAWRVHACRCVADACWCVLVRAGACWCMWLGVRCPCEHTRASLFYYTLYTVKSSVSGKRTCILL